MKRYWMNGVPTPEQRLDVVHQLLNNWDPNNDLSSKETLREIESALSRPAK